MPHRMPQSYRELYCVYCKSRCHEIQDCYHRIEHERQFEPSPQPLVQSEESPFDVILRKLQELNGYLEAKNNESNANQLLATTPSAPIQSQEVEQVQVHIEEKPPSPIGKVIPTYSEIAPLLYIPKYDDRILALREAHDHLRAHHHKLVTCWNYKEIAEELCALNSLEDKLINHIEWEESDGIDGEPWYKVQYLDDEQEIQATIATKSELGSGVPYEESSEDRKGLFCYDCNDDKKCVACLEIDNCLHSPTSICGIDSTSACMIDDDYMSVVRCIESSLNSNVYKEVVVASEHENTTHAASSGSNLNEHVTCNTSTLLCADSSIEMHDNSCSSAKIADSAHMTNSSDPPIVSSSPSSTPSFHGNEVKCSSDLSLDYTISTPCSNLLEDTKLDQSLFHQNELENGTFCGDSVRSEVKKKPKKPFNIFKELRTLNATHGLVFIECVIHSTPSQLSEAAHKEGVVQRIDDMPKVIKPSELHYDEGEKEKHKCAKEDSAVTYLKLPHILEEKTLDFNILEAKKINYEHGDHVMAYFTNYVTPTEEIKESWVGPFEVIALCHNGKVKVKDGYGKYFHIMSNRLRMYHSSYKPP